MTAARIANDYWQRFSVQAVPNLNGGIIAPNLHGGKQPPWLQVKPVGQVFPVPHAIAHSSVIIVYCLLAIIGLSGGW